MRITIQMELKLTKTYKHLDPCTSTCMYVLNYNCTELWPLKIISLCGRSIVCYVNCG